MKSKLWTQSIKEWIKRHPIEVFFVLGITICFTTLFPAIYLVPRDNGFFSILGFYLGKIGVYSPILAGIFVTRIIQPEKQGVPIGRRLKISLPVWLIALVIHVSSLRLTAPPGVSLIGLLVLSIPVALLPAWIISSAFSGTDGVKDMLATLIRPKGKGFYYLIALLTFPFLHIVGSIITNIMNGSALFPEVSQGADLAFTLFITFFSVLLFSGGLNEEAGWRGFAQKRLQAKYSPIVTIFILWFLMVIWHIPNDLLQYQNGGYLLVRIGLYPFITILFSWVYNRTEGSIWAVAIFHASMNSMNPLMGIFPITTAGNIMLVVFAIIVVIVDRMWRKLPKDHPAVYQKVTGK